MQFQVRSKLLNAALLSLGFIISSARTLYAQDNSELGQNVFAGNQLLIGNYSLTQAFGGYQLDFGSDPQVSYFKYEICDSKKDHCFKKSSIYQSIWIPPSVGLNPSLKIQACIGGRDAIHPPTVCTSYQPEIPSLQAYPQPYQELLEQKENLLMSRDAHANEAFLALYYLISTDSKSQGCYFTGMFSDYTLQAKATNIAVLNPYMLETAFRNLGTIPEDERLIDLLNKQESGEQNSFQLANTETYTSRALGSSNSTWLRQIRSGLSTSSELTRLFFYTMLPWSDFQGKHTPPARAVSEPAFQFLEETSRAVQNSYKAAYSIYRLVNAYGAYAYDPTAPRPSLLERTNTILGTALSTIHNLPSFVADVFGQISETVDYFTASLSAIPEESKADIKFIQEKLKKLGTKYSNFQQLSDQTQIFKTNISELKIDEFKAQLSDWSKLSDDEDFKQVVERSKNLYLRNADNPNMTHFRALVETSRTFMEDPEIEAIRKNLEGIYKLIDTDKVKKIGDLGEDMRRVLQFSGIVPKPRPEGWYHSFLDEIELLKAKIKGKNAGREFLNDMSIISKELRQVYLIDRALTDSGTAPSLEDEDTFKEKAAKVRQYIDDIETRNSQLLSQDPSLREWLERIDARLTFSGLADPVTVKSKSSLNQLLNSMHTFLRQYTGSMTDEEFKIFAKNHSIVVTAFGIKSPQDILGQMQDTTGKVSNLIAYWPPKFQSQADEFSVALAKQIGSYESHAEFWDKLYQAAFLDSDRPVGKILHPIRTTKGILLRRSVSITSGKDLYQYIVSGNGREQVSLIHYLALQEVEVQEKITEGRNLGVEEARVREWAYAQLWPELDAAKRRARFSFLSEMMTRGQAELIAKFGKGAITRIHDQVFPESIRSETMRETLKAATKGYITDQLMPEKIQTKSILRHNRTHDVNFKHLVNAFLLSSEPTPLRLQAIHRNLDNVKSKLRQELKAYGMQGVSLGLLASQWLSSLHYQLQHSQGNCSDLQKGYSVLKKSQENLRNIQIQISNIDSQLVELGKN